MPLILLLHPILDASVSHQLVKVNVKVLGIWFGKDNINTNWIQIQNKVKIQFEKLKDRKLSFYCLCCVLYVVKC
jgi:hypothetical protein